MATFTFSAKSISGEELKGSREAKDKFELAKGLKEEGYILIKAEEGQGSYNIELPLFFYRVSIAEKMMFARNLSVMVAAGLSLSRGLDVLSEQMSNKKFKSALLDVSASIRKGENFAVSLSRHPKIFSELFRSMVSAGEKSGKLEDALKLVSHQLKRDYDLRRKIRGAMMYPAVVLAAMVIIGVLMLIYVVPTLVSTFEELDVELPMSTKIVINISNFMLHYSFWAFLIITAFIFGFIKSLKTKIGRAALDFIFLHIPVITPLVAKANAARICRTLGSLLSSGVNILESFDITEGVLTNHYYKTVLEESKKEIERGAPISTVFIKNKNLLPLLVGEMMAVGEETGKLSEMLFRLAVFYENEVSQATKDLSSLIEPILMIVIGIFVGFFAVSMIYPLYNLAESF